MEIEPRTDDELMDALAQIRAAPRAAGIVELIAVRPTNGERAIVEEVELDPVRGAVGDNWHVRPSRGPDPAPNPDVQVTLMSARVIAVLARDRARWSLAGDQLYVDLDLAADNLPTGTRLALGTAVIEVTAKPHTGCAKFTARFGSAAARWVNTPAGRELRLRGVHARVVVAGTVRRGDEIRRLR